MVQIHPPMPALRACKFEFGIWNFVIEVRRVRELIKANMHTTQCSTRHNRLAWHISMYNFFQNDPKGWHISIETQLLSNRDKTLAWWFRCAQHTPLYKVWFGDAGSGPKGNKIFLDKHATSAGFAEIRRWSKFHTIRPSWSPTNLIKVVIGPPHEHIRRSQQYGAHERARNPNFRRDFRIGSSWAVSLVAK